MVWQNNGENEVVYAESFPEGKSEEEEDEDPSLLLRCVHTPAIFSVVLFVLMIVNSFSFL